MSGRYIISATDQHPRLHLPGRDKARAIRIAETRATEIDHRAPVTVTTVSGNEVHTTDVIAAPTAPTTGKTARTGVAEGPRGGMVTLYEKPSIGAEVLRGGTDDDPQYFLYCQSHDYITDQLPTLISERRIRQRGNWCPQCVRTNGPTTKVFGRKPQTDNLSDDAKRLLTAMDTAGRHRSDQRIPMTAQHGTGIDTDRRANATAYQELHHHGLVSAATTDATGLTWGQITGQGLRALAALA